jgi:sigma-B regulation protein RsbU (phosphoserine phosphatase)
MKMLGLRSKALLAMLLACLLALIPASMIAWHVLDDIHRHMAQSFVRNTTLLNRSKISAPLLRELTLAKRFADSELLHEWINAEQDPAVKERFFREAESFRRDFQNHSYFIGVRSSLNYYLNDPSLPLSTASRQSLRQHDANNDWFYKTLASSLRYNINIDRENALKNSAKIWFNIKILQDTQTVGIAGSSIDLTVFLHDFLSSSDPGVTAMIVTPEGAIQAHPDVHLIALDTGISGKVGEGHNLFDMISAPEEARSIRAAMREAEQDSSRVPMRWVHMKGQLQLVGLSYIPELKWHVLTVMDMGTAKIIEQNWLWPLILLFGTLLLLLILGFALVIERVLLRPLYRLQESAHRVANGQYNLALHSSASDEIGDLTRTFASMAQKVQSNTQELEQRVQERTSALEQANRTITAEQKKVADSINYASLIQRAILPKSTQPDCRDAETEVLWLPRDVVGGDFYLYRAMAEGTLLGVVDCAGHGVPGAMMTMLAYAAIDQAIAEARASDPAAILQLADRILRAMLPESEQRKALATNMDMGLAYINQAQGRVIFSGAKMSLYMTEGSTVEVLAASRRALADRHRGEYHNVEAALRPGRYFYLVSDGFLDQAGGSDGFGFGDQRFEQMILRHAHLPLAQQIQAFRDTLAAYQGAHAQRDDITLLCFTSTNKPLQE